MFLPPVDALARRPTRDVDGQVVDPGSAILPAKNERVLQETLVITLGMIGALVGATGLPTLPGGMDDRLRQVEQDRKSTRLNSSHQIISYAVFCLKKKT